MRLCVEMNFPVRFVLFAVFLAVPEVSKRTTTSHIFGTTEKGRSATTREEARRKDDNH